MPNTEDLHRPILGTRFRAVFRIRLVALATGFVVNILILAGLVDAVPGVMVFAFSVLLYTFVTLLFWRCPSCTQYPGNAVMPDYCERCGKPIFGLDAHVPDLEARLRPHIPLRYILVGRGLYGMLLLAYFVLLGSAALTSPLLFWLGTLSLVGGGVWIEWRWWRCPSCGGYLRRSFWPGRACKKCGEPLRY